MDTPRRISEHFKALVEGKGPTNIPAITTGFPTLDELTGGWGKPAFNIIGGRPAVGKSTLALTSHLISDTDHRGGDKRPWLTDLLVVRGMEAVFSAVHLINRPAHYGFEIEEDGETVKGKAEIGVHRNHFGPTGDRWLGFREDLGWFFDPTDTEQTPPEEMPF